MNAEQALGAGPGEVIVGSAAWAVSADPAEVLITYSLGSCVGLALYDPVAKIGGMAHCVLPLSRLEPAGKGVNPGMFTDTGAVMLLQEMLELGARKGRLVAWLAGASTLLDDSQLFRIGERNYAVARKFLSKNGFELAGEACGGSLSRTMELHVGDGRVLVRTRSAEQDLTPAL